ncbi:MAG TPA: serine hydrolase, partial [Patescibacteria group bacterium]|nr:serine hydrolase [Patescibacteria group bacterium]
MAKDFQSVLWKLLGVFVIIFFVSGIFLVIILLLPEKELPLPAFPIGNEVDQNTTSDDQNVSTNTQESETKYQELQTLLDSTVSQEKGNWSFLVSEPDTGKTIGSQIHRPQTAASVMKVLVATLLLQRVEAGEIQLTDSLKGLPVQTHLQRMINISDNNSWAAFNEYLGLSNLQKFAESLGMQDTNLFNNTISSYDVNLLFTKILKGKILTEEHRNLLLSYMQNTETEDRIPAVVPKEITLYHKTGSLDYVVNDAAV